MYKVDRMYKLDQIYVINEWFIKKKINNAAHNLKNDTYLHTEDRPKNLLKPFV